MIIVRPCPTCRNFTYPRKRVQGVFTEAELAEIERYKAHQWATNDGTCLACWNHAHGRGRTMTNPKSPRISRMTDHDLDVARAKVKDYWLDRRRRGIDPEGDTVATLDNGGLFCKDVT